MANNTVNVHKIIMKNSYEARLKEKEKNYRHTIIEKGNSSELNFRGRKSAFEEIFDGISLEEQNLPAVGPFEDITETESFQNGRERGFFLAQNGFTLEQYHNFILEFESKFTTENAKKHR